MKIPIRLRVALYVTLSFAVVIVIIAYALTELYEGFSYRAFNVTLQAAATSVANRIANVNLNAGLAGVGEDVQESVSDFENRIGLIHIGIFDSSNAEVFPLNDIDSMVLRIPLKHNHKFISVHWGGKKYRVAFAQFEITDKTQGSVVAMCSLAPLQESIGRIQGIAIVIVPITILLVGIGSVLIARRALRPLERMARDIDAIGVGKPLTKLDVPETNDEIEKVGRSFNALMERIVVLIDSQRNSLLDASHELKTPLTVIQTEIEMLQLNPSLTSEEKENLQNLLSEVEYASKLAVDLIYLSRLESSVANFAIVDMSAVVREVVSHNSSLAKRKGIRLVVKVAGRCSVRADYEPLKRAVSNVVENAIKYTPNGGKVEINGRADRSVSSFTLTVQDNGQGVGADELPRVFDRFYRTKNARGGDEKGSGLGLSIAKRIVEQHKGSITMYSEPGKGTMVRIEIPLTIAQLG